MFHTVVYCSTGAPEPGRWRAETTANTQEGGGLLPSRKGKTRGGVGWEEVEGGVELSVEYVELVGGLGGP